MAKYLTLSAQLKAYITSHPEGPSSASSSPAVSPKSIPAKDVGRGGTGTPSSTLAEPPSSATTGRGSATPVALVPSYQLTQTDTSACRVPIDDNYAPTDHWQWMASMWRGIVGPDVTVAVEQEGSVEHKAQQTKGKCNAGAAGGDVDVRLEDSRAVVVRVERGGKVGEGALRRVGFEIGEWARGRSGSR